MYKLRIKRVELENTIADFERRSKRAQEMFGQVALNDMQRYVPMKSGALRGSGHVENGGKQAVWESYSDRGYPYGVRQYNVNFQNYTTAGTGPKWDARASGIHMSSWEQRVGDVYK